MRIVVATGIFPPDIGGPATHAANLAEELRARGHHVTVLSAGDARRPQRSDELVRYPRRWPWPVRAVAFTAWLYRHRRSYDVVYATGLALPAVAGARAARRPVVLKIVGDPAWERASRLGLTTEQFDEFQTSRRGGPARLRAMRAVRDWSVRRASALVVPSEYLRGVVERWSGRDDVHVVPNGVRMGATGPAGRRSTGPELRAVYVGRLVAHKNVDVLVEAVARLDGVRLEVVGDGPELPALRALVEERGLSDHVTFSGAVDHAIAMERLAESDALVTASGYEGLPHVVIEAMACGTPVLTTRVGGASEVVRDGVNGIVLDDGSSEAFALEMARLRDEPALRSRLGSEAVVTGESWRFDVTVDRLEAVLAALDTSRPHAVFVGRTRVPDPLPDDLRRKFSINARHLTVTSITMGPRGVRRVGGVRLVTFPAVGSAVVSRAIFYALAPALGAVLAAGRRRSAVVCQSPFEALGVVLVNALVPRRFRALLQVEVHGDWRTAARMYGHPARRLLGPFADRVAAWVVRRADQVRVVSEPLADLVREAGYDGRIERYITFSDYSEFTSHPPTSPPERPVAAFIGVLERYKAVDILLEAWARVIARIPDARLVMVGAGSREAWVRRRVDELGLDGTVELRPPVPRPEVRNVIDNATCLVLPSRSEGLPRIVVEALARARPVVATAVGGIPELIDDGRNGRLVPAEDVVALEEALVDTLSDLERARQMGEEARHLALAREPLAEYEKGIAGLAAWISSSP